MPPPPGLYTRRTLDGWFPSAGTRPLRAAVESTPLHLALGVAAETDLLAVAPRPALRMYRGLLPIEDLPVGRQPGTGEVALIHRRSIGDLPEFQAFRARLLAVAGAPGD